MSEEKKVDSILGKEISRGGLLKTAGAVTAATMASTLYGPGHVFADGPYSFSTKKRFTIAIVPKSLSNPVFALANLGGKKRAQELGDVDYVFTANSQESAAA